MASGSDVNIYDDTTCADCGMETNHFNTDDRFDSEWYMVKNEIWAAATAERPANFLCVGCLERRIGRKLTPDDFKDVPGNYTWPRSSRLDSRMGTKWDGPPVTSTSS